MDADKHMREQTHVDFCFLKKKNKYLMCFELHICTSELQFAIGASNFIQMSLPFPRPEHTALCFT